MRQVNVICLYKVSEKWNFQKDISFIFLCWISFWIGQKVVSMQIKKQWKTSKLLQIRSTCEIRRFVSIDNQFSIYLSLDSCLAKRGSQINEVPCVLPFKYGGFTYDSCSWNIKYLLPWCATKVDNDGELLGDHWGFCNPECPAYENPRFNSSVEIIPGSQSRYCLKSPLTFIVIEFRLQHTFLW